MVKKTCGNCGNYSGTTCNQIDFEMPEGHEDASIKPTAPAKEMCGEEWWVRKSIKTGGV